MNDRPVLILLTIAIVALLIRLLPLLHPGDQCAVLHDSYEYLALAKGMLAGCGFARLTDGSLDLPNCCACPAIRSFWR